MQRIHFGRAVDVGDFTVAVTRNEVIVEVLEQQYDGIHRRSFVRIPLDQVAGEAPLIWLWGRRDVPTCVKNAVERIHSQHRRLSI